MEQISRREYVCDKLDDMEVTEAIHAIGLLYRSMSEPENEYLQSQAFPAIQVVRDIASLRTIMCGERIVKSKEV